MDTASLAEVNNKENLKNDDVFEIDKASSFNLSIFILWVCAVISMSAATFLWLMDHSAKQDLADKKTALSQVVGTISSSGYIGVEEKASAFKSAVTELSSAKQSSFSMEDFIPKVYSHINKDVVVSNIALTSDGSINIVGQTGDYRSAAEQVLTLESWKIDDENVFSDVKLGSVSLNFDENGAATVPISITAKFDKSLNFKSEVVTDQEISNTEGVTNAEE